MARKSYSLDGAVLGEQADFNTEAASYNVTEFGWIRSVEISIDRELNQFKGVKGGSTGHLIDKNIQLLTRVTGTVTFSPIDLKYLKYGLGDYNEVTGTYTINSQKDIPVFLSLKGNYDGTNAIKLKGLAFGNMNFRVSQDNVVEITAPFIAQTVDIIEETIEYNQPSVNPLTFIDGSLTYNNNNLLINDATVNMDFKANPRRNFENVSASKKYYISEIIRTGFICSFSGNADIEDASGEIEDFLGGISGNDVKADFNIDLNFVDGEGDSHSLTVSGCKDTRFRKTLTGDVDNVKNYDVTTVAIDVSATGDI